MKAQFEHVTLPSGCSIRVYHRQIPTIPFEWHHHPEYELTLTLNSRGWRFIGDHIGGYDSHDLVLVPSDMPHTWVSTSAIDESRPHVAEVVWFPGSWALQLAELCPEFAAVRKLLKRTTSALHFPAAAGVRMESLLTGLLSNSPQERLQTALLLLTGLADTEATALATHMTMPPKRSDESAQLTRVLELLQKSFAEPIRVDDLCTAGNVSARTLHRLFIRHLGESVSDYLGRLRIGRACMLLVEKDWPISLIAAEAGFSNLSNFNRRFLASRSMTPKEFRRFVAKHGRMPQSPPAGDLTRRSPSLESRRAANTARPPRRAFRTTTL